MILPDVNLLLYAYNPHAPPHLAAKSWWQSAMDGDELIGLPHEVLFGFVRIASNPRLGAGSLEVELAEEAVGQWINLPNARILLPDAAHFARAINLLKMAEGRGALLSDAVLASYAIANRARVYSTDNDFARFPDVDWVNPIPN